MTRKRKLAAQPFNPETRTQIARTFNSGPTEDSGVLLSVDTGVRLSG